MENLIIMSPEMGTPGLTAHESATLHDHRFHSLRVSRVVRETADASSFVLDVPGELRAAYAYQAGQFCTFKIEIDGQSYIRCFSMSSSPAVDAEMQVTVKRVPGGVVSNWMIDVLSPGGLVATAPPTGFFCLGAGDGDIVAFGAGSGITPVFSLMKSALATTSRRVHLLYANRDRDSVIFGRDIGALVDLHPDRLAVTHHLDIEHGFVGPDDIRPFAGLPADAEFYVCGPGPFMDVVEQTLRAHGVDAGRIHIERFTPPVSGAEPAAGAGPVAAPADTATRITIELDGRIDAADHRPGTTILQTARQMGLSPPYSCESGSCATCMAKLVEGGASMYVNNALTADEVDDGWVLTCQAVPTTPSVRVVYGFEEG